MYNATTNDPGEYPVTKYQIEAMAALVAELMKRYSIPVENVLTHAEAADLDGYGPATTCERWDLLGRGEELRQKALWYVKKTP
jgi:N-acetyl-anhydromuramyl-L-alanine amidase AmpD